jgi:glycosyltransferase involved in cell wall biosynthesis
MRLLIVSQYFWPENFRVNEMVAELVSRGHTVTVLTGRPNYPDGEIYQAYANDPSAFMSYAGAEVLRIPLRPRGKGSVRLVLNYASFVFWGLLAGPWKLRGREFDAVFVFLSSPVTSALPALLLRRLKQVPVAIWVLDLWPETLSAVGVVRSPRALAWVGSLVGFIYRRCDRILVQSRAFIDNISHWSSDTSRVRYFPGWAEGAFDGDIQALEPAPEVQPYLDTFNVMFAGNIGDAQDFPAILAAAEHLRSRAEIRWLIVGEGRAMDWVRHEIARRQLDKQVILLGRHSLERMPSFFRAASALLVSLRSDPVFAMTIPGKVQTYLASGIPLLGMLDGEGSRVIEESGAGLVCAAGDGTGLARRVEELHAMEIEARHEMGKRGQAYCHQEFDRGMLMSRLEDLLSEMALEPRASDTPH